jgi:hypothetical protein
MRRSWFVVQGLASLTFLAACGEGVAPESTGKTSEPVAVGVDAGLRDDGDGGGTGSTTHDAADEDAEATVEAAVDAAGDEDAESTPDDAGDEDAVTPTDDGGIEQDAVAPPDTGSSQEAGAPNETGTENDAGTTGEEDAGDAACVPRTIGGVVILEDCDNVLQVFEETDASYLCPSQESCAYEAGCPCRPSSPVSCTDVADWIALDTSSVSDGDLSSLGYHLESSDIDQPSLLGADVRAALYGGQLVSFNMVSAGGATLCSFVSTWDYPMKSTWLVESPPLSPVNQSAVAPDRCDNGWSGAIGTCQAQENAVLDTLPFPPPDTSDGRPEDGDNVVKTSP